MLTPIFHPNIAPHAICIGDHWSAGEPLASIMARIGEMIAYQSYNTKSPLNGEAARWVKEKYFTRRGHDHWVFYGIAIDGLGRKHPIHLYKTA